MDAKEAVKLGVPGAGLVGALVLVGQLTATTGQIGEDLREIKVEIRRAIDERAHNASRAMGAEITLQQLQRELAELRVRIGHQHPRPVGPD